MQKRYNPLLKKDWQNRCRSFASMSAPSLSVVNNSCSKVAIKTAKPDEKHLLVEFVKYLATQGHPNLRIEKWPDEDNRSEPDIDALAGEFAIEHTSVDTIANQRRDSAWFVQTVGSLEDEFRCKLPFRLILSLPYEGIQRGQDWNKIKKAFRLWISNEADKLSIASHNISEAPGIPFEFRATKRISSRSGLLFSRFAPEDRSFPNRLRSQLNRKADKLAPYKKQGKTTVILVESDDIALMDEAIMWDGLRSAYPDGLPSGVDEIWFADTSIPEEILFTDMTGAVIR